MEDKVFKTIKDKALSMGFGEVYLTHAGRFTRWEQGIREQPGSPGSHLEPEPKNLLPSASAIIVMVTPCPPYEPFERGYGAVPHYYVTSNRMQRRNKELAAYIEETFGKKALANPRIPHRPSVFRTGSAFPGAHQVLLHEKYGSFVHVAVILTDALESNFGVDDAPYCDRCGACKKACPTGAVNGDGTWDFSKCLRNYTRDNRYPEYHRHLYRGLVGCELCQRACPYTRERVKAETAPRGVVELLELEKIIDTAAYKERYNALAELIGTNVLNADRVINQAMMVAANQGFSEFKTIIEERLKSEKEYTREIAAWALERL